MNARTASPPGTAYVGWYRRSRREPWQQMVTEPTYGDAWGALFDALSATWCSGGDSLVLAAGTDPNHR